MGNRRARDLTLRQADEAEWELVRTKPRSAYADAHARGIGLRRMQLIVAPSFEDVSVWEVRQGREWQLICPKVVETEPVLLDDRWAPQHSVTDGNPFQPDRLWQVNKCYKILLQDGTPSQGGAWFVCHRLRQCAAGSALPFPRGRQGQARRTAALEGEQQGVRVLAGGSGS
jgi:hypothetical protein